MPAWNIALAARTVAEAAARLTATAPDIALIEAQLADHYRDEGIAPLEPAKLGVETGGMTAADWQRLAVMGELLAVPGLRAVLPALSQRLHVREQIAAFVKVAQALRDLEPRALAASPMRAEELARQLARELDVDLEGETRSESAARLVKIDYNRLLRSVDSAKAAAGAQLAELKRAQEAEDRRIAQRRGKW
jgi:hypothetical protein